jgi:hypothetical protein
MNPSRRGISVDPGGSAVDMISKSNGMSVDENGSYFLPVRRPIAREIIREMQPWSI